MPRDGAGAARGGREGGGRVVGCSPQYERKAAKVRAAERRVWTGTSVRRSAETRTLHIGNVQGKW